jgi:methylmalonyl-CoA/ethylmalonyl-CoA epimerase
MQFHHIGIFVQDISAANNYIKKTFPIIYESQVYEDFGIGVYVQFLSEASGIRYEIVAPLNEKNPVSGLLKQKKNLLNHVAYKVNEIDATINTMRISGNVLITPPQPAVAFNGSRVAFLYSPLGFIIELIDKH